MILLEIIKNIFKRNTKEQETNQKELTIYDTSLVNLPEFKKLSEKDKKEVLEYLKEIDLNNLESLINYNTNISKEGEKVSKLLIKFLYELEEIIRKDNKTREELNEELVNLIIKNLKITVLKDNLDELLRISILKSVAISEINKQEKRHKYEFLGIFSRAARIHNNMKLKSLEEALTRSKITIKTLSDQQIAVSNAIKSNQVLISKIDIYNKLTSEVECLLERKKVYYEKLRYFIKVYNSFLPNLLSNLEDLKRLLDNFIEDKESEIILKIAIIETEIDKFTYDNKDKLLTIFHDELNKLQKVNITIDNKKELLDKIDELEIIKDLVKEFITQEDLKKLYKLKFDILTIDINKLDKSPIQKEKSTHEEFNIYKDIISDKINAILKGEAEGVKIFKENGLFRQLIKILNLEFKENNQYNYVDILKYRYSLSLLLAFDKENGLSNFLDEFKFDHGQCHDIVEIYEDYGFDWESNLSINTICQLIDCQKTITKDFKVPNFYKLYSLLNNIKKKNFSEENNFYKIPEGLCYIDPQFLHFKKNHLIKFIRENSKDKVVIFPNSLTCIDGNLFGDTRIKGVILNDGLEKIGSNVFLNQNIEEVVFPSSLESISKDSFNFEQIKVLGFKDYKNSKLFHELFLEQNEESIYYILFRLFLGFNERLKEIHLYDESDKLTIINCGEIHYPRTILPTTADLLKIRKLIRNLIEQKTGYKIPISNAQKSIEKTLLK